MLLTVGTDIVLNANKGTEINKLGFVEACIQAEVILVLGWGFFYQSSAIQQLLK